MLSLVLFCEKCACCMAFVSVIHDDTKLVVQLRHLQLSD